MVAETGIRLILDTDIGTDVDDAWALALCLASPEIDLAGVTLVHADLEVRAAIALKMLRQAGRTDVPVVKGISSPLTPGGRTHWGGHEGRGIDFSDLQDLSAGNGAVDFILESVRGCAEDLAICAVGPLSNIGEAVRRDPETMRRLRRLVIMGGDFRGEGVENAGSEHNIRTDPDAARIVLESGVPAMLVGLNVTTQVAVREEDLAGFETSALGNLLAIMTRDYFELIGRRFTWMHDPLAVAAVFDSSVLRTERMSACVVEDGRVVYSRDPEGSVEVAVEVDVRRFENLLMERVRQLIQKGE